jgi:uncharacterized protein
MIGFSGGVDSTFLSYAAKEALGPENVVLITAVSPVLPKRELEEAKEFAAALGVKHILMEIEVKSTEFKNNEANRCYYCKKEIFTQIQREAGKLGINFVAEASNSDDMNDYRPGIRACEELGIVAPLRDADLSKAEIRALSKEFNLPTWDKPSYACLATRIPQGEEITAQKLKMVEQAEDFLIKKGFRTMRVRIHGDLARIELPFEDITKIFTGNLADEIHDEFKKIGFRFTSVDIAGYKMGNMTVTS